MRAAKELFMRKISNNKIFALVFRLFGFLIGLTALIMQFTIGGGFMANTGWVFFTVQTNAFTTLQFLILFILTAVSLSKTGAKGKAPGINKTVQLATTFYISITFIVYWTLLSWQNYDIGVSDKITAVLSQLANVLLHGVVPIFAVLDWVFFMSDKSLGKKTALIWLAYPLAYFVFVAIRANVGAPLYTLNGVPLYYPYPFLEPAILGSAWLLIPVVIGMSLAFYGLGLLYVFADKKLIKLKTANNKE